MASISTREGTEARGVNGQLLLTEPQVQTLCSLSRNSIRRLARSGELRPIKIGRSVRYARTDVERFVMRQLGETPAQ